MIGNDIIDLQLAKIQSNWQRPGFLEKQFTEKEIQPILESENSFETVWRFWSMKEAVYKLIVQQENKRFFAPKKFECKIISEAKGVVYFGGDCYKVQSEINSDFIYSVVGDSSFNWLNMQSSVDFFTKVERRLGYCWNLLHIEKNSLGIPNLFYGNEQVSSSFTKTHHGRFEAIEFIQ